MSDNRRNATLKEVKSSIVNILKKTPLRAKELRTELEQLSISYGHDRFNSILNLMINDGDIERTLINNNPYPVYRLRQKSPILGQLQGLTFHKCFKSLMLANEEILLDEFGEKKDMIDALMKFFGFYIMSSLIVSRSSKYVKNRDEWLRFALDLEKTLPFSKLFDKKFTSDKVIESMGKVLIKEYPKTMVVLGRAMEQYKKFYKELNEINFSKENKDAVDDWLAQSK